MSSEHLIVIFALTSFGFLAAALSGDLPAPFLVIVPLVFAAAAAFLWARFRRGRDG